MSDDSLFRGLEPPVLPPRLRENALAAGRAALAAPPRPDVWARTLASRAARVAWAASVAALAAANVLLSRKAPPSAPVAVAPGRPDAEVAAIARLPRIDEKTLPSPEGGRS
ncbi:MAG: hypothetical protein ABI768_07865 [Acidobacteriota bacterium]